VSLRDVLLFGVMAYFVPKILKHPYIGALAWVVVGVMNPHRLTWGAAYDFQFGMVVAMLTLIGLVFTGDHRKPKGGSPGVVLIVFAVWVSLTTFLLPFNPEWAYTYWWDRVVKMFLMTGVILLLLHTKRHVELLVWTMAVSLGFYGAKGGLFTILGGGGERVYGPGNSAIEENNALAVALVVVIPLIMHLYGQYRAKWLRWGLAGVAALCAVSVLGSWSRGAMLAISAMGIVLWLRSTRKLPIFMGALLFTLLAIPAMPERWFARMDTIQNYEEDKGSAMSRLNSWETAFNIAKDRFPIGGGFDYNGIATSAKYSPNPSDIHVAHSIYFMVIGSQGFFGVAIYLLFWALVWLQCGWIRRKTRNHPDLRWAFSLASMTQASMAGFLVGGAFLDLAFWDMPYYLYAVIGVTQYAVTHELDLLTSRSPTGPTPREAVSGGARAYSDRVTGP
jgi:probable O-glycosylation ligase (exosortase A-associated)